MAVAPYRPARARSKSTSSEVRGRAGPEYRQKLRASIARELHDGPIRELTTCVVRLEAFRSRSDNRDMQLAISAVEEHARAALMSLRRLISDLRDEPPEEDLASTIRTTIDRLAPASDAEIVLVVSPTWPRLLPGPVALNLLRIVQESMSNAIRHGSARHILVTLAADPDRLEVSVADDGLGMPSATPKGTGMRGMEERAVLLGGRLTVRRRRPGTEVRVEVPLA